MDYYLRCRHYRGLFPDELIVSFTPYNEIEVTSIFTNKRDVIKLNETEGLVRLTLLDQNKEKLLVGINDAGDKKVSTYCVSRNDVVEK